MVTSLPSYQQYFYFTVLFYSSAVVNRLVIPASKVAFRPGPYGCGLLCLLETPIHQHSRYAPDGTWLCARWALAGDNALRQVGVWPNKMKQRFSMTLWDADGIKTREKQGTLGVEPRAYRTAADCSTTELYPLSIMLLWFMRFDHGEDDDGIRVAWQVFFLGQICRFARAPSSEFQKWVRRHVLRVISSSKGTCFRCQVFPLSHPHVLLHQMRACYWQPLYHHIEAKSPMKELYWENRFYSKKVC